jgi:hypothetical protein
MDIKMFHMAIWPTKDYPRSPIIGQVS